MKKNIPTLYYTQISTTTWQKIQVRMEHRTDMECTLWKGQLNEVGYGLYRLGDHMHEAHRIIYAYVNKCHLFPEDKIRHTCDNPRCVNPEHLIKGTQKDNIVDKAITRRGNVAITRAEVIEIRQRYQQKESVESIAKDLYGDSWRQRYGSVYSIGAGYAWTHVK